MGFILARVFQALAVSVVATTGLRLGKKADSVSATPATNCRDESNEAIRPIVETVKEHFEGNGVTVFPWALTMVSAMEVGGLATEVDGAEFVADHDLDFLLSFPPEAKIPESHKNASSGGNAPQFFMEYVEQLVHEWREKLFTGPLKLFSTTAIVDWMKLVHSDNKGNMHSPASFKQRFNEVMEQDHAEEGKPLKLGKTPSFRDRYRNHVTHYFIEVVQVTEASPKLAESRIVQRTVEAGINNRDDFLGYLYTAQTRAAISALDASMPSWGHPYLGKRTLVDFWVLQESERKSRAPNLAVAPGKKVLFAGVEFPFPTQPDEIAFDLDRLLCPTAERATCKVKKLCDLYLPHGRYKHFLEDLSSEAPGPGREGGASRANLYRRATQNCVSSLHSKGYVSMMQCEKPSKSGGPEFRQTQESSTTLQALKRLQEIRNGEGGLESLLA